MQLGFFFDQTRCTGCYACQVACKDWHNVPAGSASWDRPHLALIIVKKGTVLSPILFAIDEFKIPSIEGVKGVNNFEKPYRE